MRGRLDAGVAAFKGVPYAAPPVGANRFRAPLPHEAWTGTRPALDYGPTVPHPPYAPPFDRLLREPVIPGDDCLNLNIWTPDPATSGLPVMVWIHGGAFTNGSGAIPTYDGRRFAALGTVLVTLNYRLGVDGFLLLPEGAANLGLQDQVAALSWIQDNIRAFGGDPDQVCVFGESAGGGSVVALMAMPSARGLFRRAIAQSGTAHSVMTRPQAESVAAGLAEKLGIRANREALLTVETEDLFSAQREIAIAARAAGPRSSESLPRLPFGPCVDGEVLPGRPLDLLRSGVASEIELVIGTNRDEMNLYLVAPGLIDLVDDGGFTAAATAYGLPAQEAMAAYSEARPGAPPGELLSALMTDEFFRLPAISTAEAHLAGGGRSWMYEFAWPSPEFGGRLGACHAIEIGFVFNNLDRGRSTLHGDSPPQALADTVHSAWARFAAGRGPGWAEYDLEFRRTMVFWPGAEVVEDPGALQRRLWEGALAAQS